MPPQIGAMCGTCRHDRRQEIDEQLRRGVLSHRRIAMDYGLKHHSVSRHARMGHVAPPPKGSKPYSPSTDADPSDDSPIGVLRQTLATLRKMDPAHLSPQVLMNHSDAIRKTVEAIAKIEPVGGLVVTVGEVRGLDVFIAILFDELEPYPDVRERINARFKRAEAAGALALPTAAPPGVTA